MEQEQFKILSIKDLGEDQGSCKLIGINDEFKDQIFYHIMDTEEIKVGDLLYIDFDYHDIEPKEYKTNDRTIVINCINFDKYSIEHPENYSNSWSIANGYF